MKEHEEASFFDMTRLLPAMTSSALPELRVPLTTTLPADCPAAGAADCAVCAAAPWARTSRAGKESARLQRVQPDLIIFSPYLIVVLKPLTQQ
jgi:hypothetical protein